MIRKREIGPNDDRQAWAECFLLCDYARAENGKLYIVGGGWTEIVPHELPLDYKAYLGMKLAMQWELLADAANVRIELLDKDGQVLGDPVFENTFEGLSEERPAEFEDLVATLFFGEEVTMALSAPGLFALRLLVNESEIASTEFIVAAPRA